MAGISGEDARDEISHYLEDKPQFGETWYCIPQKWWEDFRKFAHLDDKSTGHDFRRDEPEQHAPSDTLPPLDCSSLASSNEKELRHDIVEHRDFAWVSEPVYDKLKSWFGVADNTPEFPRNVIEVGMLQEARIEMFPPYVKTCLCNEEGKPNEEDTRLWQFSSQDCLQNLIDTFKQEGFAEDVRLWRREQTNDEEDAIVESFTASKDPWDVFNLAHLAEEKRRKADDTGETDGDDDNQEDGGEKDGWVLCTKDELRTKFQHWATGVDLVTQAMYMLEEKDTNKSWFRRTPVAKWRRKIHKSQKLDTFDRSVKRWYPGTVIEVEGDRVKMHYDGYHSKYDEWVDKLTSEIIAPYGTYTEGKGGYSWSYYRSREGRPKYPGAIGLMNLGNTCFMNSVVQCMSHAPHLARYFAREEYEHDVNRDNPLGWGGKVAEAWGEHVKQYWEHKHRTIAPSRLKRTIAEVQPRFSGYNQHDSSEFLQFLLDGLHEDLNRIKDKPYTQTVESNGRPDEEVALESWTTHKLRNDSVIVDRVQGQLKSRVQCPDCGRVSVTFDPYMFLSVPLPSEKETTVRCVVVPYSPTSPGRPKAYRVTAPKIGSIGDLKDSISGVCGIHPDRLHVADVFHNNIYKIYMNYEQLGEIRENDNVFVYEIPTDDEMKTVFPEAERFMLVAVLHRQWTKSYSYYDYYLRASGVPLVIKLPIDDNVNAQTVDQLVRSIMSPYYDASQYNGVEQADDDDGSDQADNARGLDEDDGEATQGLLSGNNNDNAATYTNNETNNQNSNAGNATDEKTDGDDEKNDAQENGNVAPAFVISYLDRNNRCGVCYHGYGSRRCDGCDLSTLDFEKDGGIKISEDHYDMCSIGINWEVGAEKCFDHNAFMRPEEDASIHENKTNDEDDLDDWGNSRYEEHVPLSQTFDEFTKEETLSKTDAWYCRNCGEHKQATKKFDIWTIPDLCIIHLKRFHQNGLYRDKDETPVDYPINGLDLSNWVVNPAEKETLLDLIGISIHQGGLGGGHYIAYVRNLADGQWYEFDDNRVCPLEYNVQTRGAYVLFYKKRHGGEGPPMGLMNGGSALGGVDPPAYSEVTDDAPPGAVEVTAEDAPQASPPEVE